MAVPAGKVTAGSPSATFKDIDGEETDEKLVSPDPEKTAELESTLEDQPGRTTPASKSTDKQPKYDASLVWALHKTFFWRFWAGGLLKLFSGAFALLDYICTAVISAATTSAYISGEVSLPFPTFVGTILVAVAPVAVSLCGLKESTRTAFGILLFHVRL